MGGRSVKLTGSVGVHQDTQPVPSGKSGIHSRSGKPFYSRGLWSGQTTQWSKNKGICFDRFFVSLLFCASFFSATVSDSRQSHEILRFCVNHSVNQSIGPMCRVAVGMLWTFLSRARARR